MLNELSSVIKKDSAGLYRDDGLGILKNLSGPDIERKRKEIIKVFKNCGLNITIKTNLTSVDFLDVRFNLKDNTYEPYRKPNSDPIYINIFIKIKVDLDTTYYKAGQIYFYAPE